MAGTSVLLVDDNRDAVDMLALLLEQSGFAVVPAYDVAQALEVLDERQDIDVVVSDVRMPGVDGFDFLRVLKRRFPALPIVLVTGVPVTEKDFVPPNAMILTKPVALPELKAAIERQLAEKQA